MMPWRCTVPISLLNIFQNNGLNGVKGYLLEKFQVPLGIDHQNEKHSIDTETRPLVIWILFADFCNVY